MTGEPRFTLTHAREPSSDSATAPNQTAGKVGEKNLGWEAKKFASEIYLYKFDRLLGQIDHLYL